MPENAQKARMTLSPSICLLTLLLLAGSTRMVEALRSTTVERHLFGSVGDIDQV
jgi:hypothetical protein